MGTMGNTQGVRSIKRPQRMASRMSFQRPTEADDSCPESDAENSKSSGALQAPWVHR